MTGGSKFEVSKFDGHGNFGLWQTRVKDLLAQQGIQKGCVQKSQRGWMTMIGKICRNGRPGRFGCALQMKLCITLCILNRRMRSGRNWNRSLCRKP
ncbi:Unknown protein [Striga hermonthica]|uniref:Uncharacterized protein n=1 Tax=Striga hermonthica TaxID=68872 RepID=A0A9N7P0J2_STRHE|nr:Unknown protein [Striga hermonthica]